MKAPSPLQQHTARPPGTAPNRAGTSRRSPRFGVVIPVFNHQENVVKVVEGALSLGYPVFVIDDGSTDRTRERLEAVKGITLLSHATNRGKGAALLTGFSTAAAHVDFAITLDADGQHDPAHAHRLVNALKPHERPLVVGCREAMDAPSIPWTSRFGRKFSNFWVWTAGGPRLSDTQSGFRLYPLPETLWLKAKARRFAFEVEILVLARRKNIPIRQVPVGVDYEPGGRRVSHFRPFIDFWHNTVVFTRLIFTRPFSYILSRSRIRLP